MTAVVGREEGLEEPAPSWRATALVPTLVGVAAIVAIMNSLGAPLIPTIAGSDHVSLSTAQLDMPCSRAIASWALCRVSNSPAARRRRASRFRNRRFGRDGSERDSSDMAVLPSGP